MTLLEVGIIFLIVGLPAIILVIMGISENDGGTISITLLVASWTAFVIGVYEIIKHIFNLLIQ